MLNTQQSSQLRKLPSICSVGLLLLAACTDSVETTAPLPTGTVAPSLANTGDSAVTGVRRLTHAEVDSLLAWAPPEEVAVSQVAGPVYSGTEVVDIMKSKLWIGLSLWEAEVGASTNADAGIPTWAWVAITTWRSNPDTLRPPLKEFLQDEGFTHANTGTFYYKNDGIDCAFHFSYVEANSSHAMRFLDVVAPVTENLAKLKACSPPTGNGTGGTGTGGTGYGGGGGGGSDGGGIGDGGDGGYDGGGGGSGGDSWGGSDPCYPWGCDPGGQPMSAPQGEPAPDDPCNVDPSAPGCPGSGQQFATRPSLLSFVAFETNSTTARIRGIHVVFLDSWGPGDGLARVIRYPNGGRRRAAIYLPKNASSHQWILALGTLERDEASSGFPLTARRDMVIRENGTRTIRVENGTWEWLPRWPMDGTVRNWNKEVAFGQFTAVRIAASLSAEKRGARRGKQKIVAWEFDGHGSGRQIGAASQSSASGT